MKVKLLTMKPLTTNSKCEIDRCVANGFHMISSLLHAGHPCIGVVQEQRMQTFQDEVLPQRLQLLSDLLGNEYYFVAGQVKKQIEAGSNMN